MSTAGLIAPAVRTLIRPYQVGLAWWAGAIGAGFLLILFAATRGEPDRSLWAYHGEFVRWVLFVIGLLVVPSLFRAMVAHGVTRRTFVNASGVAIAMLGVAVGLYALAGFLIERAWYAAIDAPATVLEPHLFDSTGQFHLIFAEYTLVSAAYLVAGWLVGATFQRHWLVGIVLLPFALLPAGLVELALGTEPEGPWFPDEVGTSVIDLPDGLAIVMAVGVIALGLVAGRALLHSAPIRADKP